MASGGRPDRRVLYRHVRAGGNRTSRSEGSDHDVVARTFVPATLSKRFARRVEDASAVRLGSNRRGGNGTSRSGAVVDTTGQPGTVFHCFALPARRSALVASGLHYTQSSRAGRSAHPALRALGARPPQGRVLAAASRRRLGNERTHLATALRSSAR